MGNEHERIKKEIMEKYGDKTKVELDKLANEHLQEAHAIAGVLHERAIPNADEEQVTFGSAMAILDMVFCHLTNRDLDVHKELFKEYVHQKQATPEEERQIGKTAEPEEFRDLMGLNHDE